MTLSTEVQQCSECSDVPSRELMSLWAGRAFSTVAHRDAQVTIRIVDQKEGAELNQRFRQGRGATNVLSFSYADDPHAQGSLLGDIVICAPVAKQEAVTQNKGVDAHWAHLVVHGILHLCGYRHEQEQEAEVMERLEGQILSGLGFPAPY